MNVQNINKNMLVPYYLMSSYLYYVEDKQVLSDHDYDNITKRLLNEWNEVKHYHKHLISIDDLKAGTGYAIKFNNRIKNAALNWYWYNFDKRENTQ